MAGNYISLPGVTAGADYSTIATVGAADAATVGQYLAVYLSADRTVSRQTSDGGVCCGILQNNPASGAAADVAAVGIAKAKYGATVTIGQMLKAEVTTSRLIPVAAAADYAIAQAIVAGADHDVVDVLLIHAGRDSD